MSEQEQPRKKLSLGGRKTLTTKRTSSIASNLKTKIQAKKSDSVKNFLETADSELSKVYKERSAVAEQIKNLEQRLMFAKSEPLQEALFELKTKDFELLAQISQKVSSL